MRSDGPSRPRAFVHGSDWACTTSRAVATTSSAPFESSAPRKMSRSSEASSAQCTSSRKTTRGEPSAHFGRKRLSFSSTQKRAATALLAPTSVWWSASARGMSSASSPCASAASAGPSAPSPSASRTTCTHGQKAAPRPPSRHRPVQTPWFSPRARVANSLRQRVLPMPASPVKSTRRPRPALASCSAPTRRSIASTRPTKGSTALREGGAVRREDDVGGSLARLLRTSPAKRYPRPRTVSIG